jgi:hypothetical protein
VFLCVGGESNHETRTGGLNRKKKTHPSASPFKRESKFDEALCKGFDFCGRGSFALCALPEDGAVDVTVCRVKEARTVSFENEIGSVAASRRKRRDKREIEYLPPM